MSAIIVTGFPLSRRLFAVFLASLACWAPAGLRASPDEVVKAELRVIAYNIYQARFWPRNAPMAEKARTEGQFAERLALELSLYDPDIVTFSESPAESVTIEVARRLGMNHVRFPSAGNWPGTLLSRFEIVDSANVPLLDRDRPEDLFTRHWGRAVVRLPDGELLIVHSAHLMPHVANTEVRLREITAMLESMDEDVRAGHSILMTGDLNHLPETPEHELWTENGWIDTFLEAGVGSGQTIRADDPARRIDYILATGPISRRVVESRALFEGAFRTNPADPGSFALSDHLPQLAVFDLRAHGRR